MLKSLYQSHPYAAGKDLSILPLLICSDFTCMTNGPIGSLLLGSLPWRRWQVVVIGAAIAVWIIATTIHLVLVDLTTTMMKQVRNEGIITGWK